MANDIKHKKHALNNPKIVLSAPCPTAPGKMSHMKWDIYLNNPRIVIKTNDPSMLNKENQFGMFQAGMDTPIFGVWLEMLLDFANGAVDRKAKIQNQGRENESLSDIWFGKDKDGCVFVSVVYKKEEKPVIKFIFGPSDDRYHKIFHADGTEYTRAELSVIYAKSYYRFLGDMMNTILTTDYVEPAPFNPDGGYPNKSNYVKPSGNQNTNKSISNDDLPF